MPPAALFAAATLTPALLLAAGGTLGGAWLITAALTLTLFSALIDQALRRLGARPTPTAAPGRWADALSATLALSHFALLALGIAAVTGATGLAPWERVLAFFAFGLFMGQVSNSNAHELIHRSARPLRALGRWVYISLLFGHHASAHPKVHHRFVATPDDPNSARLNESYYRFAVRAWLGSFRAGLAAEREMLARGSKPRWQNPYIEYIAGAAALLAASTLAFGPAGLAAHIGLAAYATAQLLMSDYVQHYGLSRARLPNGKYEPVSEAHSWNAPHVFSSLMMLHAPRHSDHHAHPSTPYPALTLPPPAPMLPGPLPSMATLALMPQLWKRVMNPRVARLHASAPNPSAAAAPSGQIARA
ncbi:alkane 1-monooxygenase [Vannielia litorea]|uniref:alkane 1-monooxygenase n=1 Tax=Vannielia litorea TaxID=1217970 RepID=UPI001C980402|nr:alkane 1-monooxygenase [Vannielia litorea]MBY6046629.1 alkane 1-monooxygenase [Vannielia litorea]MBY6074043.1 alkane 1-monooxygenase [Vannielia litorea]